MARHAALRTRGVGGPSQRVDDGDAVGAQRGTRGDAVHAGDASQHEENARRTARVLIEIYSRWHREARDGAVV